MSFAATIEAELARLRREKPTTRDDFWRITGQIEGLKIALNIHNVEED